MSPLDALKSMVAAYPGGAASLLPRISATKSLEVFQKELSGSGNFKLGVMDAAAITSFCVEVGVEDAAALARVFAELAGAKLKLGVRANGSPRQVMQDMNEVLREFADLMREVTQAGMDSTYTANEVKRIEREADEAIAAIQRMVADARAAHEAGKPAHLRVAAGGAA